MYKKLLELVSNVSDKEIEEILAEFVKNEDAELFQRIITSTADSIEPTYRAVEIAYYLGMKVGLEEYRNVARGLELLTEKSNGKQ